MPIRPFTALSLLLAPPACAACGAPPPSSGDRLCEDCVVTLPWLGAALCPRCALPRPCRSCPAVRSACAAAWAPLAHAGPARRLVLALKRGAPLADLMAEQMLSAPGARWRAAGVTLVPVPSHPVHRRLRGADHAAALAEALAVQTALPIAHLLSRGGPPARQAGATRAVRRRRQLAIRARGDAPDLAVLVDDVHTTGATLDACARALITAGTRRVEAVTYARALR